jgi:membrane protein YqaA with SNARE-associated domain
LGLLLLFASSLLAATLLPGQSEAVLARLALAGGYSLVVLIMVATFGNVLGSCINWLLGRYLEHFKDRRWFPVKKSALDKAAQMYQQYGIWTLLLAWVPFIGDPLTVIAGVLRTSFPLFLLLVTIGKLARYVVVVAAVQ